LTAETSRAALARELTATLAAGGAPDPAREARLILRWACGLSAAALSAEMAAPATPAQAQAARDGAGRRARGAPLSHVTGRRSFWAHDFIVTPDVLDPRPETETLVAWAQEGPAPDVILDLGVGSGCILLSLLAAWPQARGVGVDASPAALEVARRNAAALGVADRVRLAVGGWDGAPAPGGDGRFDLIVSNPPYLTAVEMAARDAALRAEPALALDGGTDGLEPYRAIAPSAVERLRSGGVVYLEHGCDQSDAVAALLREAGLSVIGARRDLDGRPRVTAARRD
jgi:release factor glutamine methyltransferase